MTHSNHYSACYGLPPRCYGVVTGLTHQPVTFKTLINSSLQRHFNTYVTGVTGFCTRAYARKNFYRSLFLFPITLLILFIKQKIFSVREAFLPVTPVTLVTLIDLYQFFLVCTRNKPVTFGDVPVTLPAIQG